MRNQKWVKLLQRYHDFRIFQDGDYPPSWISLGYTWTTHKEYLVVFITVQNLVAVEAVVSKTLTGLTCKSVPPKRG